MGEEHDRKRSNRGKDTEEVALPPIEHVEADGDIVEVDLAPDPVHPPPPASATPRAAARLAQIRKERRAV